VASSTPIQGALNLCLCINTSLITLLLAARPHFHGLLLQIIFLTIVKLSFVEGEIVKAIGRGCVNRQCLRLKMLKAKASSNCNLKEIVLLIVEADYVHRF
jgi:hypothetical protein